MVLLLFLSFSYSIWLSSHFQLLNSTYILGPLSMCLSSQVKRRSHSRRVDATEPNGVWRTPACQELNIISRQSRKAASQRPLGFLCLLIQARPTWQLSCQAYPFCLVCLFLSHSPWLTYLCKTRIPQLAISGSYLWSNCLLHVIDSRPAKQHYAYMWPCLK